MAGSDDLMAGLDGLDESRDQYDDAWSFWRGTRDEEFSSPAVKRVLRRTAGRYQVNIAKTSIVALSNRLQIAAATALGGDGAPDDAADQALQGCLVENKMTLQFARLIRNALIFGDSYLFIWPSEADEAAGRPQGCLIAYNGPQVARVIYDDENEQTVDFGIKRFIAKGKTRSNLYYPGSHLEKYILKDGAKGDDQASWIRDPEAPDDIPIAFKGGPLFHFRTDQPYGVPAHEDGWGAQDAINKLSTTMAHTSEAAGFPQRWALTDPMAALGGDAGDSPDWDDDGDASIGTEDDSRIRGGPGELAILAGIKATGQWTAANSTAFIDPADWYVRMYAMVTGTPMHYIDQRGQAPSGEALRVMDAPLLAKVDTLQQYLDASTADTLKGVLDVLGYPEHRADVRWRPPGVIDDTTTWVIVDSKIRSGVPPEVALAETGLYEADEISAWFDGQHPDMDIARRITLLGQVASAVQGLGQGVALGLLTDQQAQSVIETTIGQLTPELTADGSAG